MVLVNNPGTWSAVYAPLRHAAWHGWTPTDMVFPFFLFVVGVSIPLALGPALEAAGGGLPLRVLRRAAVIFTLGLLLHALPFFPLADLRIPGVLQRIATCYLLAALLVLATGGARGWRAQAGRRGRAAGGLLAPDDAGGRARYMAGDLSPEGNLAGYVDRLMLGPRHIWRASRAYDRGDSGHAARATTLMGVLAGHWLRARRWGPARRRAIDRRRARGGGARRGGARLALGALVSGEQAPVDELVRAADGGAGRARARRLPLGDRGAGPSGLGRALRGARRPRPHALLPVRPGGEAAVHRPGGSRRPAPAVVAVRAPLRAVGLSPQRVTGLRAGLRAALVGAHVGARPERAAPARLRRPPGGRGSPNGLPRSQKRHGRARPLPGRSRCRRAGPPRSRAGEDAAAPLSSQIRSPRRSAASRRRSMPSAMQSLPGPLVSGSPGATPPAPPAHQLHALDRLQRAHEHRVGHVRATLVTTLNWWYMP